MSDRRVWLLGVGEQRFRVIPVSLPGAKRESLPALLVNTTWVEFRGSIDDSDAFHRLVSGIRGVTPGPGEPDARGSPRTTHSVNIAVRFLYGVTLGRETLDLMASVPHMKRATRRAEVYARNEVEAILTAPRQPRDRVLFDDGLWLRAANFGGHTAQDDR